MDRSQIDAVWLTDQILQHKKKYNPQYQSSFSQLTKKREGILSTYPAGRLYSGTGYGDHWVEYIVGTQRILDDCVYHPSTFCSGIIQLVFTGSVTLRATRWDKRALSSDGTRVAATISLVLTTPLMAKHD